MNITKLRPWITLAVVSVMAMSCDIIEEPIKQNGGGGEVINGDETTRKVLIEKFTGHLCNNCPNADVTSNQIKNLYGDDVVFISYHVLNNFARPTPAAPNDWRTSEGTSIFEFYRFVGIPIGMVNRINFTSTGTGHQVQHGGWASIVQQEIDTDPLFQIDIEGEWNRPNVDVSVSVEALENYGNNVRLSVFFTQDNIVAAQLLPSYDLDTAYVHNYMFRFALTNHLGDPIGDNIWARGARETFSESRTIGPDYDPENMHVVAFIRDETTHRVLQVERKKITEL